MNDRVANGTKTECAALFTGVILAGGQGARMGGQDKGWVQFQGKPLIQHVLERLLPQTSTLLIVANRNLAQYQALATAQSRTAGGSVTAVATKIDVVSDQLTGFQGPLAGIQTALQRIDTPCALVVATDAPFVPRDLLTQLIGRSSLATSLHTQQLHHPVLVHDGEREQPLFGIYPANLGNPLTHYLLEGHRRLIQWCKDHDAEWVDFSDQRAAFTNFNRPEDLEHFTQEE
ncbi:hypothetical protein HDN1F_28480 [gamma proteobacterium HdN1]|nr:hypothetical protein HDN1F_28480 [gamma proteobacterium HdN1]